MATGGNFDPRRVGWMATVGGMLEVGTQVTASCRSCGATRRADLKKLQIALGPNGTLIDRHPPCWKPKCQGKVLFIASPGPGTPARPCVSVQGQIARFRRERAERDRIKALRNG